MPETVKVPYAEGIEEAISVEPAPQPLKYEFKLADGTEITGEVRIANVFKLLHKTDDKGMPIYVFSVQLRTEVAKKSQVDSKAEERA